MNHFNIIMAVDSENGIGKNGDLPWKNTPESKKDLEFFKTQTMHSILILGRKTWESIGSKPLPHRICIIVSSNKKIHTYVAPSFTDALKLAYNIDKDKKIWVIGGSKIYNEAFQHSLLLDVYITHFPKKYNCDVFVDKYYSKLTLVDKISLINDVIVYKYYKHNLYELQYNALVKTILQLGNDRIDRTNVGTLSTFGSKLTFDLSNQIIPLLTTKRVFWRGVVEELLWFISGSTNANVLKDKGVHIWDKNSSKSFLESRGFKDREEGDLGPVYGFQWRHFGAKYKNHKTDYKNQGIDQLQHCIHLIRNDPNSRRILFNAWNVNDLDQMALPPCHIMCQFYVNNGTLSCQMYQRSADIGLGVPFNIASYSLLTHMIAHICGLQAKEFIYIMGDTHIYKNHVEPLKKQLERTPKGFPLIFFNKDVKEIDDFKIDDIKLLGYHPYPNIKMDMAV